MIRNEIYMENERDQVYARETEIKALKRKKKVNKKKRSGGEERSQAEELEKGEVGFSYKKHQEKQRKNETEEERRRSQTRDKRLRD